MMNRSEPPVNQQLSFEPILQIIRIMKMHITIPTAARVETGGKKASLFQLRCCSQTDAIFLHLGMVSNVQAVLM